MLMPAVRQGPTPDGNRKGGNQPAHQSMSTDVQRARLLPCTTLSALITNAERGLKKCDLTLESGHQSVAPPPLFSPNFPRFWRKSLKAADGRLYVVM